MKFTSAYADTHFAIFQRPNYVANKLNKKFNPASAPQPQSLWNAIAQAEVSKPLTSRESAASDIWKKPQEENFRVWR